MAIRGRQACPIRRRTRFPPAGGVCGRPGRAVAIHVADGEGGAYLEIFRDGEFRAGTVGVETAHAMDVEIQGYGLQAQLAESGADIVDSEPVGRRGVGEGLFREGNGEGSGVLRPVLIFRDEEAQKPVELRLVSP